MKNLTIVVVLAIALLVGATAAGAAPICPAPENDIIVDEYNDGQMTNSYIYCDLLDRRTLRNILPLVYPGSGFDIFSMPGYLLVAHYRPHVLRSGEVIMDVIRLSAVW